MITADVTLLARLWTHFQAVHPTLVSCMFHILIDHCIIHMRVRLGLRASWVFTGPINVVPTQPMCHAQV